MTKIKKSFAGEPMKADAKADIALINKYSLRELSPDEVFVFNVNLCDDQVDRQLESFSPACLRKLEKLFIGKPLIQDHEWSANNQQGRIYKTQTVRDGNVTRLRASIYMLRSPGSEETIRLVEAGILREVSIGVSVKHCTCSVCGEVLHYDYRAGNRACENGHVLGEKHDGELIHGVLDDPADAFEVSLVAVPAQRQAGITKGMNTPVLSPEESAARKALFETAHGIHISDDVWSAICSNSLSAKAVAEAEIEKKSKGGILPDAPNEDHRYGSEKYALLPLSAIDKDSYRECMTALGFARKDLSLPPITIRYFIPISRLSEYGLCEHDVKTFEHSPLLLGTIDKTAYDRIYIRHTGNHAQMQKAVLHETYHVMQFSKVGAFQVNAMEKSAYEYGENAFLRLFKLSRQDAEKYLIDELTDYPQEQEKK